MKVSANILITISICLVFLSCKNDIKKIKSFKHLEVKPTEFAENIEIVRTDSGRIVLTVFAPQLLRYTDKEDPYTVFPKGVTVVGYNYYPDTAYSIRSDFAINYEKDNLWKAKNDVVAINRKGEQLNTEEMFWDEKKEIIYSDKFSRITNEDGIFYGENGFVANQDFTKWKLKNISNSTVNVKDE